MLSIKANVVAYDGPPPLYANEDLVFKTNFDSHIILTTNWHSHTTDINKEFI